MLVHSWDTETRGPPPSSLPTVGRALGGAVLAAHTQDHPGLTEQWGQTKPLMFSTSPITRSPTFLQKVSSRLTSPTDTAWRPGKGQGQQIGEKGTAERLPQGEGACSGTVPEAW